MSGQRWEMVDYDHLLQWQIEVVGLLEELGLLIWELRLPPGNIPRHEHPHAFFCALLGGSFESFYGRQAIRFDTRHPVYHPQTAVHSSKIGPRGARIMTIEATTPW